MEGNRYSIIFFAFVGAFYIGVGSVIISSIVLNLIDGIWNIFSKKRERSKAFDKALSEYNYWLAGTEKRFWNNWHQTQKEFWYSLSQEEFVEEVALLFMHLWWYYLLLRILKGLIFGKRAHDAGRDEYEGTSSESDMDDTRKNK